MEVDDDSTATPDDDSTPVMDDDTTPPDDDSTPVLDDDSTVPLDDDSTPILDDDSTPILDDDTTVPPDDDSTPIMDDDDTAATVWTAEIHDMADEAVAQVYEDSWELGDIEGAFWFGKAVDISGDINGDGFEDVLVVEPGDHLAAAYWEGWEQHTFVFFGPLTGSIEEADADIVLAVDSVYPDSPPIGMADLNADGTDDLYCLDRYSSM